MQIKTICNTRYNQQLERLIFSQVKLANFATNVKKTITVNRDVPFMAFSWMQCKLFSLTVALTEFSLSTIKLQLIVCRFLLVAI
jgi:hypothetical protein